MHPKRTATTTCSHVVNKWDVVLLSFPFTDLSATKVRPAVVISPDTYNKASQDAVVVLITTNTSRRGMFDLLLEKSHPEFLQTGLRYASAIRIDKIFTLNKRLVVAALGRFGPQLISDVEKQLRLFLQLPGEQLALKI
jgi:mRNA interferase MazF